GYVFPMIRAEGTAVRPLREGHAISLADGHPTVAADRLAVFDIGLFKPRDDLRRLRLRRAVSDVVVRQRAVKRILSGNETNGNVVPASARLGIIEATVVSLPIGVPGTRPVGDGIIRSRLLAHPENGGYDAHFPRIAASRNHG